MTGHKTRRSSGSNITDLIGKGKQLLASELPTARNILQLGIYLKETDERPSRQFLVYEMVNEIYLRMHAQWMKANALFMFPVMTSEKQIKDKLKDLWTVATTIANKGKISQIKKKKI